MYRSSSACEEDGCLSESPGAISTSAVAMLADVPRTGQQACPAARVARTDGWQTALRETICAGAVTPSCAPLRYVELICWITALKGVLCLSGTTFTSRVTVIDRFSVTRWPTGMGRSGEAFVCPDGLRERAARRDTHDNSSTHMFTLQSVCVLRYSREPGACIWKQLSKAAATMCRAPAPIALVSPVMHNS